jgi:hypothetical protein
LTLACEVARRAADAITKLAFENAEVKELIRAEEARVYTRSHFSST